VTRIRAWRQAEAPIRVAAARAALFLTLDAAYTARALRQERQRAGRPGYDIDRHLALFTANRSARITPRQSPPVTPAF
jgi:hypothetical protein